MVTTHSSAPASSPPGPTTATHSTTLGQEEVKSYLNQMGVDGESNTQLDAAAQAEVATIVSLTMKTLFVVLLLFGLLGGILGGIVGVYLFEASFVKSFFVGILLFLIGFIFPKSDSVEDSLSMSQKLEEFPGQAKAGYSTSVNARNEAIHDLQDFNVVHDSTKASQYEQSTKPSPPESSKWEKPTKPDVKWDFRHYQTSDATKTTSSGCEHEGMRYRENKKTDTDDN